MAIVTDAPSGQRALEVGATLLLLRPPQLPARRLEEEARRLVQASPVPVLISSRIDVAMATGAAGVNLPEHDVPVVEARRLLPDRLIGRSIHSLEQAREAEQQGANYIIYGPVFPTASHPDRLGAGLSALRQITSAVSIPVLAIGGMNPERWEACRAAGASGFAAISYYSRAKVPT
jgi:thiamine-phosphate diphosphorylase